MNTGLTQAECLKIIDDGLKSAGSSLAAVEARHRMKATVWPLNCLQATASLWLGTYP